jgi:exodeoxyribonuclease V alpha subunit
MGKAEDIIIEGRNAFLPSYYKAEKYCGSKIREMAETKPVRFRYDVDEIIKELEKKNKIEYSSRQKDAIRAIENTNLLIITGGPGTGKTTIVKAIIQVFKKNFPSKIVKLVAPTGRAAKRMEEATGLEAKTIHRELEFMKSSDDRMICRRNESNPIDADLFIVDESSMIDIYLFTYLIRAIKPGTKVIFVGDADQLPSVGPGNVFRDMIESGVIPVIKLDEIFRQEDTSKIVINADYIRKGKVSFEWGDDFIFIREDDKTKIPGIIREMYLKEIERCGDAGSVQVLSPFRIRTDTGVDNLNRMLQEAINPKKEGSEIYYGKKVFRKNDKVMQFRNDYSKEVFNGDIGFISSIYRNLDGGNEAVVNINGREIIYSQEDFEDLDLAYATTIHKAQGSEYDVVIIPMTTQHYIFLQRNIIYTAVTRARKKVIIIGKPQALYLAVRNNKIQERNSKLKERILYP